MSIYSSDKKHKRQLFKISVFHEWPTTEVIWPLNYPKTVGHQNSAWSSL